MPINKKHKKEFGVYYWDTFEKPGEDTFFEEDFDTVDKANAYVNEKYKDRIRGSGADVVEIVDKQGNIVAKYQVG